MKRKKTAGTILTIAWIAAVAYLIALALIIGLQKSLKTLQSAPIGARNLFYVPYDNVIFAVLMFAFILTIALVLIKRMKTGGKTGTPAMIGMIAVGGAAPFLNLFITYLESLRLSEYNKATEAAMNYIMSASYVHDLTAYLNPLLLLIGSVFLIGATMSLSLRD